MAGDHITPRRKVPATAEQWLSWQTAAAIAGLPVSRWLAAIADKAAERALKSQSPQRQASSATGLRPRK